MPPRKSVPSLFALSLTSVGAHVTRFARAVARDSYAAATTLTQEDGGLQQNAERRAARAVDAAVAALRRALFSSAPWYAHQALCDACLRALADAVHNSAALYRQMNCSSPESVHEIHVVVAFARVVLHQGLRRLDLSKLPKMLRDELQRHLDRMTGLRALNLGSGGSETGRRRLYLSLRGLRDLTSLTMPNDCQNETLAVVGQNCPRLAHLDVNGSSAVGDSGAAWLLQCRELEKLDLYLTTVSVEGYARLLLGLPKLRTVGRCDSFGQVLEYLDLYSGSSEVTLPVEHFHSRDMSYPQLRLLLRMCPRLSHVNLYVDEDMGNLLEPFRSFEHLRELKLLACNFYADGIDQLLEAKGGDLTLLHLEYVDELDMRSLCCIAEHCRSLQKLVFFSCDFVENFGSALRHHQRPRNRSSSSSASPGPFESLEELVCVSETAPNVIEFLLTRARNLRRVQFGSTAWFNDELVEKLLSEEGALAEVEEIRILRSYELTMRSVELLLDSCPRLRVLTEMDGWDCIRGEELERLRHRIRKENLDLDTFISIKEV